MSLNPYWVLKYLQKYRSVSYTHLDVYKRQPKYANRIIKQLKAFKKAKKLDDSYDPYKAAYGSMPVSYTHLDVYKRQIAGLAIGSMMLLQIRKWEAPSICADSMTELGIPA